MIITQSGRGEVGDCGRGGADDEGLEFMGFWPQISRSRCFAAWCPCKARAISLSISEEKRVLIWGLVEASCDGENALKKKN